MITGCTRKIAALLAAGVALTATPVAAQTQTILEAPVGRVRGEQDGAVRVFRGLPYAEAPVGSRRWRPPAPSPSWGGVRDATRFGAACPQPASPFHDHAAVSEDCLFLNVWTSAGAQDAPVLVWIHGGSLVSGAGSDPLYDGSAFADRGVVVVTINYRLGALGWLAHPALSAESPEGVSGNYGLLDQIEALRWIQRNIRAFGGDPGRVTIAGESAGALSALYLMTAPEARGLFHGVIAQSAYLITMPELRDGRWTDWPDAETAGAALADRLGAPSLEALRDLDTAALVGSDARSPWIPLGVIDGRHLPRQPIEVFDRGDQADVPLLAGYNEGEIRSLRFLLPPAPADTESYEREIRARYGDLAEAFLRNYPSADLDASRLSATRDALYGWTSERIVRDQTALGQAAFLYMFNHGYPAAEAAGLRAFHGSEIPFVFGGIDATPGYWPAIPATATEQRLSDAMTDFWAGFARDGRPGEVDGVRWSPYGEDRDYMAFENAPIMRAAPPNGFDLVEEVVCRRRGAGLAWHWNVGTIAPPLPVLGLGPGENREPESCGLGFGRPVANTPERPGSGLSATAERRRR